MKTVRVEYDVTMKKIVVLGCSGSGKSTFALRLHDLTGLPLYHLDNIWWKPDRTHISREEFDRRLDDILNDDRWILDGDYSRTYEKRIAACDTVFFLDYTEEICMDGIIGRIGKERRDIPWTENKLDPELVKLVKDYETQNKPVLIELFRKYADKDIVTFHTRDEADNMIKKIFTTKTSQARKFSGSQYLPRRMLKRLMLQAI